MSYSTICAAIITELQTDMPAYQWQHDWRDELPDTRADYGFVWGVGKEENQDNVQEEITKVAIRLFPNFAQRRGQSVSRAHVFEDAAETLQTALQDKQTAIPIAAGFWYMRIINIDIDQEGQRVDAEVHVWGSNPGVVP